jgi:hypothetical protein
MENGDLSGVTKKICDTVTHDSRSHQRFELGTLYPAQKNGNSNRLNVTLFVKSTTYYVIFPVW